LTVTKARVLLETVVSRLMTVQLAPDTEQACAQ
jgi:hypothetical protein